MAARWKKSGGRTPMPTFGQVKEILEAWESTGMGDLVARRNWLHMIAYKSISSKNDVDPDGFMELQIYADPRMHRYFVDIEYSNGRSPVLRTRLYDGMHAESALMAYRKTWERLFSFEGRGLTERAYELWLEGKRLEPRPLPNPRRATCFF